MFTGFLKNFSFVSSTDNYCVPIFSAQTAVARASLDISWKLRRCFLFPCLTKSFGAI